MNTFCRKLPHGFCLISAFCLNIFVQGKKIRNTVNEKGVTSFIALTDIQYLTFNNKTCCSLTLMGSMILFEVLHLIIFSTIRLLQLYLANITLFTPLHWSDNFNYFADCVLYQSIIYLTFNQIKTCRIFLSILLDILPFTGVWLHNLSQHCKRAYVHLYLYKGH